MQTAAFYCCYILLYFKYNISQILVYGNHTYTCIRYSEQAIFKQWEMEVCARAGHGRTGQANAKKNSLLLELLALSWSIPPPPTVLPAKSDSDFMFCLQSYHGLLIDRSLVC